MAKRNFKYDQPPLNEFQLSERLAPFAVKLAWFVRNGYTPHYYQLLFHSFADETSEKLLRFRHLVAGRRGGKTLSAAWETAFYCLFPEEFHWDAHKERNDRPLYVWVLYKDNPTGLAAWTTFRSVLKEAGLTHGKEYKENRGNRWFEFANGSFVHFRTAEDPESLRGAGLDIMWIDEAAFIPNERAWQVSSPALGDKEGLLYTTTTPSGKNWFWTEFWQRSAEDPDHGRVEYRSIDNEPGFPRKEWERYKRTYHPLMFQQEFMASFDAMQGIELPGEWLKYYTLGKPEGDKIEVPRRPDNKAKLDVTLFMGVDPAISLADTADRFAMSLVGVSRDNGQLFLLDQYVGRIPFPEQIDKIQEWQLKYKPLMIGVEANAYQRALVQQLERIPGFANVVPVFSEGKKHERILRMAPLFKVGRVRIREDQKDFIDEWLNYDSQVKNPKDDALDSVEIAISLAGSLLPPPKQVTLWGDETHGTLEEAIKRDLPGSPYALEHRDYDEEMGADW